jgi:serine/threonine protein kinase
LGCIIYELINLKPPFYDENEGMVWKKILSEDFNETILPKNCEMK